MKQIADIEILKTFNANNGMSHYVNSKSDAYQLAHYYQNASQTIVNKAVSLKFPNSFVVTIMNPIAAFL